MRTADITTDNSSSPPDRSLADAFDTALAGEPGATAALRQATTAFVAWVRRDPLSPEAVLGRVRETILGRPTPARLAVPALEPQQLFFEVIGWSVAACLHDGDVVRGERSATLVRQSA